MNFPPPVHVAGHGRSGTTIVGQLFEGIPGFKVLYERSAADLGWDHIGAGRDDASHMAGWVARSCGGKRLVDKEPRHVLRLQAVCEATGGQGIHVTRDGRDVACSVVASFIHTQQDFEAWLRRRTSDQLRDWALSFDQCKALKQLPPKVAVGCFWAYLESKARALHGDRIRRVRYETLVKSPPTIASDLALFLELDQAQERVLVHKAAALLTNNPRGHVAHASSRLHVVGDRTVRVGRWRQQFTEEEAAQLRYLCGEAYKELGYGW